VSQSARLIVRFAAALLPVHSRERYREQWLGELRDAPALGIRASEIAIGSVAFVATLSRPMSGGTRMTADVLTRRSRWTVALSLSAAIVAISQYASVVTMSEPINTGPVSFAVFVASTLLTAYAVLAPIIALVTVLATRGVARRVRVAVGLLALASVLPTFRGAIDDRIPSGHIGSQYLTPGMTVYPAAVSLVALAGAALWREIRAHQPATRPQSERFFRRLLYSGLGGLVVAVSVALGFADTVTMWAARTLPVFGYAFTPANRAEFEEWLTLKVRFEDMVSTVLGTWIFVGIAIALAIAVSGLSRRSTARRSVTVAVGVLCIILVSYGGLVIFLQLATSNITPTVPVDLVMLVGRWGLIALVLITIGRGPGHNNVIFAQDVRQDAIPATDGRLVISPE
jgi:hypothetical protein